MMKASLAKTATIAGAILAAGWLVLAACSNQAEGERCETNNNNDDCADGLVCTSGATLRTNEARCCPPDLATATVAVCRPPLQSLPDSAPPPDTGPPPTTDAGSDADATTDGAVDDAADASDSG